MKTLKDILNEVNCIIPKEVDQNKKINITTDPKKADQTHLLVLTKKANSEKKCFTLDPQNPPYAIMCEKGDEPQNNICPIIYTDNARKALSFSLKNYYNIDFSKLKVVGVTGTNGKTATAKMIHHILTYSSIKSALISTGDVMIGSKSISEIGYSMTTPDPEILYKYLRDFQDEGCEYVIMEVSSHALKLCKTDAIPFEIGIFTNLSEEHRDFHKDMDDYYRTKLSLFDRCKYGIFNIDDKYARLAYIDAACEKISVGLLWEASVYATEISLQKINETNYYYREKDLIFPVKLKIGGSFNLYNSLLAIKCALLLGIKPCIAKNALNALDNIPGRMECIEEDGISTVIDYAHTPLALENILKFTKQVLKPKQKLILVFGCGGDRDRQKRAEMGKIASSYADRIILTEDNSRSERTEDIIADIASQIPKSKNFTVIPVRELAVRQAVAEANEGDIILLCGKGCEKYIINSLGTRSYDERKEVEAALKFRRSATVANKA